MLKFKLKPGVGRHTQKNPKTGVIETFEAKDGKVILSAVDLVEMFPDKFDRVSVGDDPVVPFNDIQEAAEKGASELAPATDDSEPLEDTDSEEDSQDDDVDDVDDDEEEDDEPEPLGVDKTEQFDIAVEQDFKVFYKKGKGYFVADADEPFVALNKKKLTKAKVEKFIDSLLE